MYKTVHRIHFFTGQTGHGRVLWLREQDNCGSYTRTSFPQPQHWRWVMDGFSSSISIPIQLKKHIKVMEYHRQSADMFLLVIKYLFHSLINADQFITLMSFSGLLVDNQSVNEVKLGDYKKGWWGTVDTHAASVNARTSEKCHLQNDTSVHLPTVSDKFRSVTELKSNRTDVHIKVRGQILWTSM